MPLACRLGSQGRAVNSLLLHSAQPALVWDGAALGRGEAGSLQRFRGESQRPDQVEEDGRGTRWGWRPEGQKEQERDDGSRARESRRAFLCPPFSLGLTSRVYLFVYLLQDPLPGQPDVAASSGNG